MNHYLELMQRLRSSFISKFIFLQYDHAWIEKLSHRLVDQITASLPQVIRNGDPNHSYPGCVNLSFAYVEGESLLMALKGSTQEISTLNSLSY